MVSKTSKQSFNKGEWSELYTFFKLILDNQLHFGNEFSKKLTEYVTVFEVAHNQPDLVYQILNGSIIFKNGAGRVISTHQVSNLITEPELVSFLQQIKTGKGRSFTVLDSEKLKNKFQITTFKGVSKEKGDISISFEHDTVKINNSALGIKSYVGAKPTLLNASGATNFIFKIVGFNGNIDSINSIQTRSKIKDRLKLLDSNFSLIYKRCEQSVHENNLRMVDSKMPEIIAQMLLSHYLGIKSTIKDMAMSQQEICRVKDYLKAVMLGMFSTDSWNGKYTSNGTIVVQDSGDLTLYHVIKDGILKDYLFENTKLDTPSSSRHRFGTVYAEGNEYFIKLNLQIRMT